MPILLLTGGQIRLPVAKGRRKGPETSKSLREDFVKYVSCSFVIQSVPAGIRRNRACARSRRQGRRRLPSLQYREVRPQQRPAREVANHAGGGGFYPRSTRCKH